MLEKETPQPEQSAPTTESVDELKDLIKGYQRILASTVRTDVHTLDALKGRQHDYFMALLIESIVRLVIVIVLISLIVSKLSSWDVAAFLAILALVYAVLEGAKILAKLDLFRRAFK